MSNSYYNRSRPFQPRTVARGEDVKAELTAIEEGFDKLPVPIGDGSGFDQPITVGEGVADGHMITKSQADALISEAERIIREEFTANYILDGTTTEISILGHRIINVDNQAGGTIRLIDIPTTLPVIQFVLRIKDAGKYAITWPDGFKWAGNNKPALKVDGIDEITITLIILTASLTGSAEADHGEDKADTDDIEQHKAALEAKANQSVTRSDSDVFKPAITVIISDTALDKQPVFVSLNGRQYYIKRNVPVKIPLAIYNILIEAQEVRMEYRDGERYFYSVQKYPLQVVPDGHKQPRLHIGQDGRRTAVAVGD